MAADDDVAIVGYGPTGVTTANMLGSAGLWVVAIERDADIYSRARTIATDEEIGRIRQSSASPSASSTYVELSATGRSSTSLPPARDTGRGPAASPTSTGRAATPRQQGRTVRSNVADSIVRSVRPRWPATPIGPSS